MTWKPGHRQIADLIAAGDLDQVVADHETAQRLLADAARHLDSAQRVRHAGDLAGAYQIAYDALRKSATALLAAQGLRATSRGGHIAVQRAVIAQFGSTIHAVRSFNRIRRARNKFEYPDTDTPDPTHDDVTDAIDTASRARTEVTNLLDQRRLTTWR